MILMCVSVMCGARGRQRNIGHFRSNSRDSSTLEERTNTLEFYTQFRILSLVQKSFIGMACKVGIAKALAFT